MAWLTGVGCVLADEFVVNDVTVPEGKSATLEVQLNNTTNECAGFQFLLTTADGVTASNPTKGSRLASGFTTPQLSEKDGGYQLLSYNTDVVPATGTSGAIAYITLTEDGSHEVGATINASLTECKITDTEGHSIALGDVNFTITIGEPRILFDENSEVLPSYTAGEKDNVRMTRTIKAGEWSTIVLPFTLTKVKAEEAFGSDVQLAVFTGFETEYADEDDLTPDAIAIKCEAYTMTAKKGMAGGTPYLIKTKKDIESFEADDATLIDAVTDVTGKDEYDTSGKFTGTFVKDKIPNDGLFLSGNKFWYSTGKTNVKAFRAWFELGAVLDKETDFGSKIRLVMNDEATGIVDVGAESRIADGVYTLQGVDLGQKDVQSLPKGIYIVNGKKVVY